MKANNRETGEEKGLEITIRDIRKGDYKKAVQFAIAGMHFDWYFDNSFLLNLYGQYFWYSELNRATQAMAADVDGKLAGVLLAEIQGEEKACFSPGKALYVKAFDALQRRFSKRGAGAYLETNEELFAAFAKSNAPDGEILFFAVNPAVQAKGIGSRLLGELEQREKGKILYLYTDDACTYSFYERRGFTRSGEKDIVLDFKSKKVPLKCFLYSKRMGGDTENEQA